MDTCAVRGGHVGSRHAKVVALLFFRQKDSRTVTLEFYKCRAFCPLLFLRSSLLEEASLRWLQGLEES